MSRSVLHVGPPASSAEPQEFLPADHSIAAFAPLLLQMLQNTFCKHNIFSYLHMQHIKFKLCFQRDEYLTYEAAELLIYR